MHHDPIWTIILSGGEGERTRAFIERWLGYPRPKQYCTFLGTRSLLQHTIDRAGALSPPERRIVVTRAGHEPYLDEQLGGERARVLVQPESRGTAPAVFLALSYVMAHDPEATVVVFPADHFIHPKDRFLENIRRGVATAEGLGRQLVLMGIRPESPESDYGWILPGPEISGTSARPVRRFVEKPDPSLTEQAFEEGGLWNTLIVVGRLAPFWQIGWRCVPEIMQELAGLPGLSGAPPSVSKLKDVYRRLPSCDFSSKVLQSASEALAVVPMSDVYWSDWGRPERILQTVRELGRAPRFPAGLVASRDETAARRRSVPVFREAGAVP